jgi:hypothetical protein
MRKVKKANNDPSPGSVRKALEFRSNNVDYRKGRYGVFVMGTIVFLINFLGKKEELGISVAALWSTTAALKQGTYPFFFSAG